MGEHRCTQAGPPRPVGGAVVAALCVHDMLWECYANACGCVRRPPQKCTNSARAGDVIHGGHPVIADRNNRNYTSPAALLSFLSNPHTNIPPCVFARKPRPYPTVLLACWHTVIISTELPGAGLDGNPRAFVAHGDAKTVVYDSDLVVDQLCNPRSTGSRSWLGNKVTAVEWSRAMSRGPEEIVRCHLVLLRATSSNAAGPRLALLIRSRSGGCQSIESQHTSVPKRNRLTNPAGLLHCGGRTTSTHAWVVIALVLLSP